MENYLDVAKTYLAQCYDRFPVCIVRSKEASVFDLDGKEYIDFTSGIGVNSLGYANSKWVETVCSQANTLAHISNLYYTLPMLELAKKLCDRLDMKKAFFANSGAESNEAAIKTARKYANDNYHGKRTKIATLLRSFHGRTMTTLAATGQEALHRHFHPFPEGFYHLDPDNGHNLNDAITEDTAAVMIELIQGEGGVIPLRYEWVKEIEKICKQRDILLIVDEVQTGIGRTGRLCAFQIYGINPDLVTLAKGLGGGLPIGALLINEKCHDVLHYGDHGSTFGANPVCCAAACTVLDTLDMRMLRSIRAKGEVVKNRIVKMPLIQHVSGTGLMIGAELEEGIKAKDVVKDCLERGLLLLTAKDRLRLLPPLTIQRRDVDRGLDVLEAVLKERKEKI